MKQSIQIYFSFDRKPILRLGITLISLKTKKEKPKCNISLIWVLLVGGVRLGLTKPEVADLQSAAIAAMRPSHLYSNFLFVVEPVIGLEPTTC